MENTFLDKIHQKQKPVGSFSELCSPYSVECMALAGVDYVIIDMEHGPAGLQDVADGIKAAELCNMTPFVRLPSLTRDSVLRPLDLGAKGIIAPCVEGVEDVKKLIQFSKYAPSGQRGVAFGRGSGWGMDSWITDLQTYFDTCNKKQLLIPQCETLGCYQELEAILQFPEVAGIFIGPFDLSAALGIPGQINDSRFQQAVEHVMKSCHDFGKFCIIYVNSAEEAAAYFKLGMDSVVIGMDAALYISMYKTLLADIHKQCSR